VLSLSLGAAVWANAPHDHLKAIAELNLQGDNLILGEL